MCLCVCSQLDCEACVNGIRNVKSSVRRVCVCVCMRICIYAYMRVCVCQATNHILRFIDCVSFFLRCVKDEPYHLHAK